MIIKMAIPVAAASDARAISVREKSFLEREEETFRAKREKTGGGCFDGFRYFEAAKFGLELIGDGFPRLFRGFELPRKR